MSNLFNRARPDATAIRQLKELISDIFGLPKTAILSVAELQCHEVGCPPIETVVTARYSDSSMQDWRIAKPVNEITFMDIENLKMGE